MEEQRQKPSAPPTISLLARVRPKHTTHHARHEPTMPAPHKQAKHVGVFARNPFDATTAHLTNTIWALLRNMDLFSPPELSAPLSSRPSRWGHAPRTHGHISPKLGHAGAHLPSSAWFIYTRAKATTGWVRRVSHHWGVEWLYELDHPSRARE